MECAGSVSTSGRLPEGCRRGPRPNGCATRKGPRSTWWAGAAPPSSPLSILAASPSTSGTAGRRPRGAPRRGRVYLDPFRNGFAQTVVAPYAVRRRPKAPVSTPLDWSEVTSALLPSDFNLGNFLKRLEGSNPWRDFFRRRQSLDAAFRGLRRL